jgi:pyruvate dehydrogenase E2 component (dihydrolipoamide acetyltransferase)
VAARINAVTMPKWGIEMTEGTIANWRVGEGQPVERGAEILDVETDKIVNAVEAPAAGVLRRILARDGETHAVGALIGVVAEEHASDTDISRFIESFVAAVVSFDPDGSPAAAAPSTGVAPTEETRVSPIARRVAERLGVDLSKVAGTGRNGRISKEDVEAFAQAGGTAAAAQVAAAAPGVRRIRMSARRGTIARRLLESKQSIPHFRLDMDVDFGPLLQRQRAQPQAAGDRHTVNDLLLRATALALVRHPMVNAQLDGDEILQFEAADIAIAVAAEAGLVTPILRCANLKPVAVIAAESRDLIDRARRGSLLREEISGGSFTVSNLGMYGVTRFDAIINAPQVAILAVGAATQRPVVRAGSLAVAEVATLTLAADHRVVDGAVGAAFLSTLRALIEAPAAL